MGGNDGKTDEITRLKNKTEIESETREVAWLPVSKAQPQKGNQTTDRKDLHGTRENILLSDHSGVIDGQSRHSHE